jgi:hypothetical protein
VQFAILNALMDDPARTRFGRPVAFDAATFVGHWPVEVKGLVRRDTDLRDKRRKLLCTLQWQAAATRMYCCG